MSNVLFLGDAHLGHKSIAKYRTQFRDEQDHFDWVEQQYHKRVTKRDKCIFMGDAVFSEYAANRVKSWRGHKELVVGNHDTDSLSMKRLCETFDSVFAIKKYHEFWLTHAPLHTNELRGKFNIHGHVHNATIDDCRYINTSLENTNFELISLHEIRQIVNERKMFYKKIFKQANENLMDISLECDPIIFDSSIHYKIPVGLK